MKSDRAFEAMLAKWRESPATMVRELFGAEPDPWQEAALEMFPSRPRMAFKASKGPGKTTTLSWLAWNFLLTRPHPNIAATSISADNLRDGLWKEMAHWRNKSPLLQHLFEWQTERIFYKESPATWFMSARSWSKTSNTEQVGNTLAGLHADYVMFIIDESGAIPTAITMAAEAGLSSCVEGHVLQAGNTNTLEGSLYDAAVRRKHLWEVIPISGDPDDPLRSPRVDIEWAREMIRTYGREDPYVKLMVLGEWPAASINALIGPDEVEAAMRRQYQQHDIDHAARILGVDTADEGDDASVIFPRQGLVAFPPRILRGVTGAFGAGQISRVWDDWQVDACFIDNTGGYGGTWRDALRAMNRNVIPIGFADAPNDKQYANKRAEIYFEAVKWIRDGGGLPNVPEMVAELSQTTYTIDKDRLKLEPKKLIKAKLGRSPDRTDAFCLTFSEPVASKKQASVLPAHHRPQREYDPFASLMR
jgi:hypothetical protein